MNKISNQFVSIEQAADRYFVKKTTELPKSQGLSFEEILKRKQDVTESSKLRFSKHAATRLADRNISLSAEQSKRLENGVLKADEKGIRESLVVVDSLAFIVNIPNKTVVTAMDQTESEDNIFTNIDGAVFM